MFIVHHLQTLITCSSFIIYKHYVHRSKSQNSVIVNNHILGRMLDILFLISDFIPAGYEVL